MVSNRPQVTHRNRTAPKGAQWIVIIAALYVFGGTGCSGRKAGAALERTYVLSGVGSSALPAPLTASPRVRIEVVEGSLRFRRGGVFDKEIVLRRVEVGGADSVIQRRTSGSYTISGDSVALVVDGTTVEVLAGMRSGQILTTVAASTAAPTLDILIAYTYRLSEKP